MYRIIVFCLFPLLTSAQSFTQQEISTWKAQATQVSIIRDKWGIPHVYGKTDADAVFGLLYAQCEDDFERIEMNYIEKLGRTAEVKGESQLYEDLMIRLVLDSAQAIADYQRSPAWLKKLLDAHAAAINFFLSQHQEVKPLLLKRFQPWYPLLWTDGSIGDINTAEAGPADLKAFYGNLPVKTGFLKRPYQEESPTGSNGFAFGPSITQSGKAILYINPHVPFYFRPEVQVTSQEGLQAYGAVTWGQFFIYQGFNNFCGWMHTTGYTDVADLYAETVRSKAKQWEYYYNKTWKPVTSKKISLRYLEGGILKTKHIEAFFTHHGPIVGEKGGKWLAPKANNRNMNGLIQCWNRTKASSFAEFQQAMELRSNTSNNTTYADRSGNIAYWHGNFIPIRDTRFNWNEPVDGSLTETEWKGIHPVKESIHVFNPANGWIQNCNSTPFTACGNDSPKKENYPSYMCQDGETFRGVNAARLLSRKQRYDLDKVIEMGYDNYLAAFEVLIPPLVKAFDGLAATDSLRTALEAPIHELRRWDYRCQISSVATTLAIEWGERILPSLYKIQALSNSAIDKSQAFVASASPKELLLPLAETIAFLQNNHGKWQVTWGELNRFQRNTGEMVQRYDDKLPSLPVGFVSSFWGMLPAYNGRYFPGTVKRYGTNGNSFVCAVEFGDKIQARSLLAGGISGNPQSKHFADQALMYTQGTFKQVLFYKQDVEAQAEKTYHPGQ
jgi:acyl-homoserine-lactone acylase